MSDRLPWFKCNPSKLLGAMAGLTADENLVYLTILLRIYDTGGPITDDAKRIARRCGLTERRAAEALKGLEEARKIVVVNGSIDSDTTHETLEEMEAVKKSAKTGGLASAAKRKEKIEQNQPSNSTDVDRASSGEPTSRQLYKNKDIELETKVSNKSAREARSLAREKMTVIDAEFEGTFWPGYPHKVGKADARRAFHKARLKIDLATIMAGLRAYVAGKPSWQEWKSPAAWLNAERWSDQPAPASSAAILSFGHDPPRAPMTEAEKIAAAKKFDEDYRSGRLS